MLGRIEMKNAARDLISATIIRNAANDNNAMAIEELRREVKALQAAR